jgi:hypothetical protein
MKLVQVDPAKIATQGKARGMSYEPTINEFLNSGLDVAELQPEESDRKIGTVLQGIAGYLKNHPSVPVKHFTRKGEDGEVHLFLARRDTEGGQAVIGAPEAAEATEAPAAEGAEAPAEGETDPFESLEAETSGAATA